MSEGQTDKLPFLGGETVGGKYRLTNEIGRGGFATVWRAEGENGPVAIKFLEKQAASDVANHHRFEVEADTLARLRHPSIARSHGSFEHRGMRAIAMDFIDGVSLRREMAQRSKLGEYFTWTEISDLLSDILGALAVAHDAGIVHRDLKPANIMVRARPTLGQSRTVLLDFGVAKLTGLDRAEETTMGRPIGTAHYMAPEQHESVGVGPPADLFAVGVLLFELATLRRPWVVGATGGPAAYHDHGALSGEQNNFPAILYRVMKEKRPAITAFRIDAPNGVAELIHAALAVRAAERPQTAKEFLERFVAALEPMRRAGTLEPPRAPVAPGERIDYSRTLRQGVSDGGVPAYLLPTVQDPPRAPNVQFDPSKSGTPMVVPVDLSDPEADGAKAGGLSAEPPHAREPALRSRSRSRPNPLVGPVDKGPKLATLVARARSRARIALVVGAVVGALVAAAGVLALGLSWVAVGAGVLGGALFGLGGAQLAAGLRRRFEMKRFQGEVLESDLFRWERKSMTGGGGFEFEGAERRYAKTSDALHLMVTVKAKDMFRVFGAPITVVIEKPARSDIRVLMRRWEGAIDVALAPGAEGQIACPVPAMTEQLVAATLQIKDVDLRLMIREALAAFAEEIVFTSSGIRMTIQVPGAVSPQHQALALYRACSLFSSLYWWGETQAGRQKV